MWFIYYISDILLPILLCFINFLQYIENNDHTFYLCLTHEDIKIPIKCHIILIHMTTRLEKRKNNQRKGRKRF